MCLWTCPLAVTGAGTYTGLPHLALGQTGAASSRTHLTSICVLLHEQQGLHLPLGRGGWVHQKEKGVWCSYSIGHILCPRAAAASSTAGSWQTRVYFLVGNKLSWGQLIDISWKKRACTSLNFPDDLTKFDTSAPLHMGETDVETCLPRRQWGTPGERCLNIEIDLQLTERVKQSLSTTLHEDVIGWF